MIVIMQACRDMVKEWDRRDASRRKALSQLQTKSPMPNASRLVTIVNSIDLNLKKSENITSCFASSEQKAYLEKVKQERLVKEELMSQDDEEDIPVTEREMNLKVTLRRNEKESNQIFLCFLSSYFKEALNEIVNNRLLMFIFQGLASNWDLDMFREAQARASKVCGQF